MKDSMKSKAYWFEDRTGDAEGFVYEVYPGIQLAYHSVHMDRLHLDSVMEGSLFQIHHCREGRIEQEFEDHFFYLTPGDLSIAIKKKMVDAYHFPLRHYHGITIGIDMNAAPEIFRQMLREVGVCPGEVTEKLCADKACFILCAEKQIEHVFSELYSVPENIREGYFKLKIMELFVVLSSIQAERNQLQIYGISKENVQIANQAAAYLTEHMDEHVTIADLARAFGVSQSHLKTIFKGVYGVPIFAYTRIQKMQSAGYELIHTEKSIAEIAEEFGYANTSKFAAAFQAIIGESPSEYRRAHRKQPSNM